MMTCTLSDSLSAMAFCTSSGVLGQQRALCRHLASVGLAHLHHAVGLGIGQLLARFGFSGYLDAARLGRTFGLLDARGAVGLRFQRALLDQLLHEGQHMGAWPPPAPWRQ